MTTTEQIEKTSDTGASWRDLASYGGPVVVMAGGVLLQAVNMYLTSSLLPSIVGDIGGQTFYAWTTTTFLVMSVVAAMLVSQLLARLGTAGAYVVGFGAFVVGTLIGAAAPSMAVLLLGRGVQGFGGGLLAGLAFAVLRSVLPERLWTRALALLSGMYAVGTLAGPAVGGAFAQYDAWRAAFVVTALAAAGLGVVAGRALAGQPRGGDAEPVPVGSLALLTAAVAALSIASIVHGVAVAATIVLAVVLVLAFIGWERKATSTVMPRATYERGVPLRWIYLTLGAVSAAAVTEAFTPLFGQEIGGLEPFVAGFLGAAISVGWSTTNVFAAEVHSERTKTMLVVGGPAVVALGLLGAAFVPQVASGGWAMLIWALLLIVAGSGIGASFPHLAVRAMSVSDDPVEAGKAAAGINTTQMIAMSTMSALGGVLVNVGMPDVPNAARNLQLGLAVVGALGVITVLRALQRPRSAA
ncbi:MFS transporter [Luteipulveratus mongoliensis]|uniref:Major facilitator superfamily (MFS) profile domain-containing protein n=1 Tax=Luteipulveratus mongoliensis TaxID=571913 RepID=A0A0K1JDK8_9MICO|nr:MFS transporter [Luteipulveratus mongoliensis]AKU14688.1 hypothetical protein VV02_00385 [Luteipulveratus mongoliensis]